MAKPKIRFKGYTEEWEERKLGDEAIEILAGGDIDKEKVVDDGTYPIYANALTNDGIVGYYNHYYRVKAPAVTVTGRGEVGHAQARNTDFTPVVRLLAIRSNHDCYFLENAINNHKVVVESTGVPQLTVPQLSSYDICFPKDIEEEEKIGEYFFNLDHLITLHQQKCEETKTLKKYMLQKMFVQNGQTVPQIRFKGFTEDWEERKLGDIAPLRGGFAFKSNEYRSEGVPIVRISNILSDGSVGSDFAYYNEQNYDEVYTLYDGATVLAMSGATTGKVSVLYAEKGQKYYQNQRVGYFVPTDICEYSFIRTIMRTPLFADQLSAVLVAGAQPNVSSKEIDEFEFMIPKSKDEQRWIGEYFQNLDHLITLHQQKCNTLKNIKKYMLQNMFV